MSGSQPVERFEVMFLTCIERDHAFVPQGQHMPPRQSHM